MYRRFKSFLVFAAVSSAAIAGYCASTAAQPAAMKPGDDTRPLFATPADITDGKRLAATTCAGCHGAEGISAMPNVPHLAGQRPAYLYLSLIHISEPTRRTPIS